MSTSDNKSINHAIRARCETEWKMSTDFSEDTLVEQPATALFSELDYKTANCFHEKTGSPG